MKINPHVLKVCKLGQGHECCRYLICGPTGWRCAKLNPALKVLFDQRVRMKTINARGDNCEGQTAQFLNADRS